MAESSVPTSTTCPSCGEPLQAQAKVCKHCLHVVDQAAWDQHDAGRLGADDRGGGKPLEDPRVGPIPISGSGVAGASLGGVGAAFGALGGGLRLVTTSLLRKRSSR